MIFRRDFNARGASTTIAHEVFSWAIVFLGAFRVYWRTETENEYRAYSLINLIVWLFILRK